MGLNIPEIIGNASRVIDEADRLIKLYGDKEEFGPLKQLISNISAGNLNEAMQEIGQTYVSFHSLKQGLSDVKITAMASRADLAKKSVIIESQVVIGPAEFIVATTLSPDNADHLAKRISAAMKMAKPGTIIMPGNFGNG